MQRMHLPSHITPTIRVFELCRGVLEKYEGVVTVPEINAAREALMTMYQSASKLNYASPAIHCAYIRTDVPFHANVLSAFLEDSCMTSEEFKQMFLLGDSTYAKYCPLTTASIGCGPGSDMVGLAHFLMKKIPYSERRSLFIRFYDSCPEWQTAIRHFIDELILQYPENCVDYGVCGYQFLECSLTSPINPIVLNYWLRSLDLYIFSWVLSDIVRSSVNEPNVIQQVKINLKDICTVARIGSFFLFIDTTATVVDKQVFKLPEFLSDTALDQPNFSIVNYYKGWYQLPSVEQKMNLGKFYDPNVQPKLNKYVHIVLFKKIED